VRLPAKDEDWTIVDIDHWMGDNKFWVKYFDHDPRHVVSGVFVADGGTGLISGDLQGELHVIEKEVVQEEVEDVVVDVTELSPTTTTAKNSKNSNEGRSSGGDEVVVEEKQKEKL
jgi:hypothetical protein